MHMNDNQDKAETTAGEVDPTLLKTLQELKAVEKREANNAAIRAKTKDRKSKAIEERKELNKYIKYNLILWPLIAIGAMILRPDPIIIDHQKNQAQAVEIMQYLTNNFGVEGTTATWFIEIDSINIDENDRKRYIEVLSTLERDDPEDVKIASSLCGAVSSYWYNHRSELDGIRILGSGDRIIIGRYSFSDTCQ